MENYTLETTRLDFENGKLTKKEFDLICDFIIKRDLLKASEDLMENHFRKKVRRKIAVSVNKSDTKKIKEGLRIMPECVGKVLLFREIIMKEDTLR